MKKLICAVLILCMAFSLCACGGSTYGVRELEVLVEQEYSLAFRNDDSTYNYVTAAIETLNAEGTVGDLTGKWFGSSIIDFKKDAKALEKVGMPEPRTFIIGVDINSFPMAYVVDGNYWGFDVQLAMAVCERLGWTLQYQSIANRNAYVELSSGNVDCAWGGMVLDQTDSKDSKKKQKMTLTAPYLENRLLLIVRGDSKYRTGSSLKGTTVLLGTDETYMAALSSEEKLMKNFGAAQRVTGGSKACFGARRRELCRDRCRQRGARLLHALMSAARAG